MPELLISISPERLARWKRRYPIHWREMIEMLEADEIIKRGAAHPRFTRLACYRTWELMLSMYDLASPTERHRQSWRRSFREMLAEHPIIEEMFPAFRWRLNEHDQWVKHGFDTLDPDEIEGGWHGNA
jgi:hypothetical protein